MKSKGESTEGSDVPKINSNEKDDEDKEIKNNDKTKTRKSLGTFFVVKLIKPVNL